MTMDAMAGNGCWEVRHPPSAAANASATFDMYAGGGGGDVGHYFAVFGHDKGL